MINTWLGPAHTKTPLHTDPHHNILSQVVGRKYVRLYAPSESMRMYPRGWDGVWGVDMGNTSSVDLEEVMGLVDSAGNGNGDGDKPRRTKMEFLERFPDFLEAKYVEDVLEEGECLFIPRGWWHYVLSLSPSFSVSFWWD
jgi:lysine-specific demethylase 8